MCSVKFASHCPSKHVSILLYFLIYEVDTHSSTLPKQDYTRLPRHRNISEVVLGALSWKSGNSCFTGIECFIFLTGTGYKSHVLHLGVDQNRNVPNQGEVFIG